MKTTLLFAVCYLFLLSTTIHAQTPNWLWARSSAPITTQNTNMEVGSVTTDASGNAIMGGYIIGDSVTFPPYTIYSPGGITSYLYFLVKYSPSGQVLWLLPTPEFSSAGFTYVATDQNGDIFATGAAGVGNYLYMMKVSSSGSLMWIDSVAISQLSSLNDVTTDRQGNAYFTGTYTSTDIVFGHDTLHGASGNYSPFDHCFVAKYSPSGAELWARTVAPTTDGRGSTAEGIAVATDMSNNLLAAGNFNADSLIIGSTVIHGPGINIYYEGFNGFIAKYDANGNTLWARALSSISTNISDVTADPSGNVYVYGGFADSLYIDDSLLIQRPNGSDNIFLLKFDPDGHLIWDLASNSVAVSNGYVGSYTIVSDMYNHIFISGGTFDHFSWSNDSIFYTYYDTQNLNDNSFILMLDTGGHIICGETFTAGGDDANALAVDPSGFVYWAGDYLVSPFVIGRDTLITGAISENAFLAKFTPCGEKLSGIENISGSADLQIYPNPVSSTATVKYHLMQYATDATLTICDVLGRVKYSCPLSAQQGEVNINTTGLTSGVYFYSVMANSSTIMTRKMVVE